MLYPLLRDIHLMEGFKGSSIGEVVAYHAKRGKLGL
jgi:hypothetical protein